MCRFLLILLCVNLQNQPMRMKVLIFAVVAVFYVQSALGVDTHEHNKVVCYWNSTAFDRQGNVSFDIPST